jgi:hypothetical protein
MNKIKKLLFTIIPIIFATQAMVSCNTTDKITLPPPPKPLDDKVRLDLKSNFEIDGTVVDVKEDMAILTTDKNLYNGKINEKYLSNSKKNYARADNKEGSWQNHSIMIGKSDSIIYLFDEDDEDGLKVGNFGKTHFLKDTSVASSFVDLYKK